MEKVAVAEVEELPKTIVRRVVKDKLSQFSDDGDIIIHKDGLRAFCESARIFIHYLSATANDLCKESRRQTINADDVLKAIEEIEFPEFVQPLKASLDEFRKKNAGKKAGAAKSKEAKKRKEDSSLNNEGDKGKNDGGDEGNEVKDDSHEPKQKSAGKKSGAGKSKKVNKKRKVEEVKQDNEGNEDEDDSHANE
ncbi:DNA polymerase epsilon subunit 3 [Vitis riparia]|uniref:DNA polymerase epsilon subunit 3 n=1 Tax=Vitis riparia TaxID=96939 RepID=UPI00155B0BBD|nr:DNA polymerase epsilon subunit 3 [Vitis riparia]